METIVSQMVHCRIYLISKTTFHLENYNATVMLDKQIYLLVTWIQYFSSEEFVSGMHINEYITHIERDIDYKRRILSAYFGNNIRNHKIYTQISAF